MRKRKTKQAWSTRMIITEHGAKLKGAWLLDFVVIFSTATKTRTKDSTFCGSAYQLPEHQIKIKIKIAHSVVLLINTQCISDRLCCGKPTRQPRDSAAAYPQHIAKLHWLLKTSIILKAHLIKHSTTLNLAHFQSKHVGINCVTRAPLLYFIRSWVALSFKVVSQWVSQASVTPVQISALCNI